MRKFILVLALIFCTTLQASESTWKKYWKPEIGMSFRDWYVMRIQAAGVFSSCVFFTCDYSYDKNKPAYYVHRSFSEGYDSELLRGENNWERNSEFHLWNRYKCEEDLRGCEGYFKNLLLNSNTPIKDRIVFRTINNKNTYYFFKINYKNVLESKLFHIGNQKFLEDSIVEVEHQEKLKKVAEEKLLAEKNRQQKIEKEKQEKLKAEEDKKLKLAKLDKLYGDICKRGWLGKGFEKNTKEYENCLINEDQKVIAKQKEKENLALAQQQKLAKMSADDRRDYTCTEKFGFRKGSQQFNDCRFKLFTAEMELEKLQIQKELAQAKLEAAKASEAAAKATAQLAKSTQERQEALANAQIQASLMQSAAAAAQAYAIQQQSATDLIVNGLNMMSPRSSSTMNLRTNCTYHARMLSCY